MSDIHLSGFLFNASGAALESATVEAFAKNTVTETGGTAAASTTTNSSGYYTMTVTSDNEYDVRITSGNSVRWRRFDDRVQIEEIEVSTLNIREGATAQVYTIAPGSISADRTLTLPAATGSDTLASLGLAQTFTANQAFTGTVTVGTDGSGTDVILYSGTSGDNVTWDASEEVLQITGTDGATALDVLDGDVRVVDKLYLYDRGGEYLSSDGSTLTITGATTVSGGLTSTAASNTLGATSFNDAAITNVGDIALDSISADNTDINIAATDNSATAFTIKQGSDAYLIVDTANSSESVSIGTGISGTAITIGHSTSETTVADNLTVTGDMTVNGTTTTVNSTTLTVDDPIITLGGDTAPGSDDNKDRGVEFRYHDGSCARIGFFGYDDSASVFTGLTVATNSSEVFSGTVMNAVFGNIGGTLTTAAQANVTTLAGLTSLGAACATTNVVAGDITMYNAVNNGNPTISLGSASAERLIITTNYDSGAQTLCNVEFSTAAASGTANKGKMVFDVDGTDIATIDDGGIDLASGKTFSINGSDLPTSDTTYTAGDGLTLTGTDFDLDAAITTVTSILATDIKIGEDDQTKIDFAAANIINLHANNIKALSVHNTSSKGEMRFYEGCNYVGFAAPALSANQVWALPTADGSCGQVLKTDGSGALAWASGGGPTEASQADMEDEGTTNADRFVSAEGIKYAPGTAIAHVFIVGSDGSNTGVKNGLSATSRAGTGNYRGTYTTALSAATDANPICGCPDNAPSHALADQISTTQYQTQTQSDGSGTAADRDNFSVVFGVHA